MTEQCTHNPEPLSLVKHRWWAMAVLCLATLMIVLDTTIVNVALPSIRESLGFSEAHLAWVVNGYMLTFGGFLLLGGRLGDLYGQRRLFMIGMVVFTIASLVCGFASSQVVLIVARGLQGLGGAVVDAVALSLVMSLFTEPAERAKAMGVYGFVAAGGGALGVVLGGVLTQALSWHWTFWVNVPVGVVVLLLSLSWLPKYQGNRQVKLDGLGALTITAALVVAVYAIMSATEKGWTSAFTLGLLGIAAVLFGLFVWIERTVAEPLIPFRLLRGNNLWVSGVVGILWASAMFSWFFLGALYMERVLHYNPLKIGLAFLPSNVIMALFSLSLSAKLVMRFGTRNTLAIGMLIVSISLAWFARAPIHGDFWVDVFPSMCLLGIGCGMAMTPIMIAAMEGVPESESGLASGILNTSFMMGGALGLAILASVAASRTLALQTAGAELAEALTSGYRWAFAIGAVSSVIASVLAVWKIKQSDVASVAPTH